MHEFLLFELKKRRESYRPRYNSQIYVHTNVSFSSDYGPEQLHHFRHFPTIKIKLISLIPKIKLNGNSTIYTAVFGSLFTQQHDSKSVITLTHWPWKLENQDKARRENARSSTVLSWCSAVTQNQERSQKLSHKIDGSHKHIAGHFIYPLIPLYTDNKNANPGPNHHFASITVIFFSSTLQLPHSNSQKMRLPIW